MPSPIALITTGVCCLMIISSIVAAVIYYLKFRSSDTSKSTGAPASTCPTCPTATQATTPPAKFKISDLYAGTTGISDKCLFAASTFQDAWGRECAADGSNKQELWTYDAGTSQILNVAFPTGAFDGNLKTIPSDLAQDIQKWTWRTSGSFVNKATKRILYVTGV